MEFRLETGMAVLERTPRVLDTLMRGMPDEWMRENEGPDTWSPFDILGHLVHGEKEDWIARTRIILEHGTGRPFDPFDRFAQFETSKGKSVEDLLAEFADLRTRNLSLLREMNLNPEDFDRKGTHPALGECTLKQLLATWVVHDLSHLRQIFRVMARQYRGEVGPWQEYLPVLTSG